jgi:hypothetical protein
MKNKPLSAIPHVDHATMAKSRGIAASAGRQSSETRLRVMSAERRPDAVPVPAFGPRMACTACGIIGAAEVARPGTPPKKFTATG